MKILLTATGVVIAAFVASLLLRAAFPAGADVEQSSPTSLTGKVISVEETSSNQPRPGLRRLLVQLNTGETVQAWAPDACVVMPGYVTRLARTTDAAGGDYLLAKDPNDS